MNLTNKQLSNKRYREKPEVKEKQRLYMIEYRANNKERRKQYDIDNIDRINYLRRERYKLKKDIILERNKQRRIEATKDGYYYLYYLPEHHYVGVTNWVHDRMYKHRRAGRITEGYEVIAKFERAVDAHLLETLLHQRGYLGFSL